MMICDEHSEPDCGICFAQNPDWAAASKALHLPEKLIKKYTRLSKTHAAVEAARLRNQHS